MRLLVVAPAPLGDTLFITPALSALRRGFREAEIDVLAAEESAEILRGNEKIDSLITVRGISSFVYKILSLRSVKYNLAAGLSRTGSLFLPLVRADKKAGFMNSVATDSGQEELHAVDYCLSIVEMLGGIPEEEPELELPFSSEDCERADRLLYQAIGPVADSPLIAVHPGGRFFSLKKWPAEKFEILVRELDKRGVRVVLVGGEDDCRLAERIINTDYGFKFEPLNLCGHFSLKETAALLERCFLFVGNDSAPMHMACAAGIPVIALFGPTCEANFHPYGSDFRLVTADIDCRPCFYWHGELKQYLPDYLPEWAAGCSGDCMEKIAVEDVLEEIDCYLTGMRKELI